MFLFEQRLLTARSLIVKSSTTLLLCIACGLNWGCNSQSPDSKPEAAKTPSATSSRAATTDEDDAVRAIERLAGLIEERLHLMEAVAAAKWNAKLPVSNPQREADLVEELVHAGRELGLPDARTREFFEAQIRAARHIQEAAFEKWKAESQPPHADVRDLEKDLRPEITELSRSMLKSLAAIESVSGEEATLDLWQSHLRSMVTANPQLEAAYQIAFQPLLSPRS